MCYTHNSSSIILITFYTLLMITFFIINVVKNLEKVIFVSRFDLNFIKKVVYFFVIFLYVEVRVFIDFFLNKELVSLLIIFLNIILKMNE